jgi:hypothetical protein
MRTEALAVAFRCVVVDDGQWQQQPGDQPGASPYQGYQGPPRTTPPPTGWRPPHVIQPAPPRRLPEQDHAAIDEDEARARTLTRGLAMVAGALLLVVLCSLCGRTLF